jgi:hypothetical protein
VTVSVGGSVAVVRRDVVVQPPVTLRGWTRLGTVVERRPVEDVAEHLPTAALGRRTPVRRLAARCRFATVREAFGVA